MNFSNNMQSLTLALILPPAGGYGGAGGDVVSAGRSQCSLLLCQNVHSYQEDCHLLVRYVYVVEMVQALQHSCAVK